MKREQRWELRYVAKGEDRVCYPRSEEKKNENLAKCKQYGYEVVSCKKLYPFNTYKNQHNFELIHNIVMIELYDIWSGDKSVSNAEYDRLQSLRERTEKYFGARLPVAWVPWDVWKDMKEISENAIIHRQNACIEAGRYDLVQYC